VRTPSGEMEKMPHGVARLMASMLEEMAEGHTVALVSEAEEVSTSVAAAFLGVSRPHVVKLIETGLLPRRMAGSHRRVRLADLVAYKRNLDGRRAFLDDIAGEAQEAGLYDDPPANFARSRKTAAHGRTPARGRLVDSSPPSPRQSSSSQ
jgi:excisionase family DNA binding protein